VKHRDIIIITGCSGSGKSTVIAAFEDAGFYCIDNMPAQLVPAFLDQLENTEEDIAGYAFCMDLRDRNFLSSFDNLRDKLKQCGHEVTIVFLDADEKVLLRRFSQTRRHHPLGQGESLVDAIRAEKKQLEPIRDQADHLLDTTHYNVHMLKFAILNIAQQHTSISGMAVNVVSFGFKHGAPGGADMVIDVRFLDNPYFVPELKAKSGETEAVRHFVLNSDMAGEFLSKYLDLLDYLIPLYEKEGKAYLTVAIGCTGGRHRSVVIAQQIYDHICRKRSAVRLIHRDIQFG
jgi:RNase adapter protein RapZ